MWFVVVVGSPGDDVGLDRCSFLDLCLHVCVLPKGDYQPKSQASYMGETIDLTVMHQCYTEGVKLMYLQQL